MKLDSSIAAVVTGGASGLGEATVRALAAQGVKCAIFDMNEAKGEAVAKEVGGVFCKVNVTSEEEVDAAFAKAMAADMSKAEPEKYLSVATKAKRQGRIFIDYLRNGRGNTAVAAYSARARPGAAVSAPLEWSELTAEIGPAHFTVNNMGARLSGLKKDPWDGFFAAAEPLPKKAR